MTMREDATGFLHRWARLMEGRDVDRTADLFSRDDPLVTFSDGARLNDWLDVRVRLKRDLERVGVDRAEVHDIVTQDIAPDVLNVSFVYDLHCRDMWGMTSVLTRVATMTLVRTKDGLRIATAHFSAS